MYMGYNLVLYMIHNISVYKWHRFCKSIFIFVYSLFIIKCKKRQLKTQEHCTPNKSNSHVKLFESKEGMMPTPRTIFLNDVYQTIEMSVKLLLLFYIICNSFKSYWRLIQQHTGKKVNIFLQTPPLSFGLSPGVKMSENVLLCLSPQ